MSARSAVEVIIPKKTTAISDLQLAQKSAPSDVPEELSVDEELRQWKQARKHGFKIPWRQLSLMASLCFGIASFALPDSVNSNVQWLLFALMGASFYAGVTKRRAAKR